MYASDQALLKKQILCLEVVNRRERPTLSAKPNSSSNSGLDMSYGDYDALETVSKEGLAGGWLMFRSALMQRCCVDLRFNAGRSPQSQID